MEAKAEGVKNKPQEPAAQRKQPEPTTVDLYWGWVKANPMLTANDAAAFGQDDGVIVVLTDKLGRSVSTASFFLPKEVVKKIASVLKE